MHLASLFVPQSNSLEVHLAQTRFLKRVFVQCTCAGSVLSYSLLRRLRSRGFGSVRGGARGSATAHAPPQPVALEVRTWGGSQESPGSASPLSSKLPGGTGLSSHAAWSVTSYVALGR